MVDPVNIAPRNFVPYLFTNSILGSKNLNNTKLGLPYIDKYWFYINEEDNEWYKTLIIFGWIAGVLCILPTIFTSIEIIFRVLVGGTLTILNWILSWILSIFILLQMVGLIPSLAYLALEEKHKSLAKLVGLILLCITLYIVITLWNTIMDWSFMFPPLKFNI